MPPSSSEIFWICWAAPAINELPTSVEPVKVTLRTTDDSVIALAISLALPGTTLKTPRGTPACSANAASAVAENGVWLAGLITMVQPAASAAAALRVIIDEGKFHGVMAPTTPTGCLVTTIRCRVLAAGMVSP